jgi:DDE superfamily endonuclease
MYAEFTHGLSQRGFLWAVGILSTQNMYGEDVKVSMPRRSRAGGRPRVHPKVGESPCSAARFIEKHGTFRQVAWRMGTNGRDGWQATHSGWVDAVSSDVDSNEVEYCAYSITC